MRVVVALAVGLLGCRYHFGEQPSSDGQLEDVTSACTPGTVSAPRAATDCPFGCHNPKLRWIGDRYVLCWKQETSADESTPNELLCTTLDRDGVQASPPRIIPVAGEPTSMSLTWSGSDFVLSYTANPTGDYEIYMLRFDTAFSPQPVVRVTNGSGTGWGTANAWTGSQVGISFYDYTTEVDPSIYFARLATDGSLLGTTRLTTGFRAFGT